MGSNKMARQTAAGLDWVVRGVADTHAGVVRSAVDEPQLAAAHALTGQCNGYGLSHELCKRALRIGYSREADEITLKR
jgi:hypothetical protein